MYWKKSPTYCKLCGNNQTKAKDRLCKRCRQIVRGPMHESYKRWLRCCDDFGRCCGGISSDVAFDLRVPVSTGTHLSFHGKNMEGSYKNTSVEHGVSFYPDCAGTYFIRDFGYHSDSEEFGELISYEDPDFWEKLEEQWQDAPRVAHESGMKSCVKCGNHYYGLWREHRPYCGM